MDQIVQNEYIQLAVIISGILSLVLISVQGFRAFVLPLVSAFQNGISKARSLSRVRFETEVSMCLQDSRHIAISVGLRLTRAMVAAAGLLMATQLSILANFLFIPGYRERVEHSMVLDISADSVSVISNIFLVISVTLVLDSVRSTVRFLHAVKVKIGSAEKK